MTVKVLAVVPEFFPLVKTGGLADVAGALPAALRPHGVETATLLPAYPGVSVGIGPMEQVLVLPDLFGGAGRVLGGRMNGNPVLVLDAPHLFGRQGNPYVGPDGRDWPDNAFRFAALGYAAARLGLGEVPALTPDVVHGHDWQAGLAMAYLAYADGRRPATVMTIHNLAYQGRFSASLLGALKLPSRAYAIDGVEYYGSVGFLKAGLQFADRITTVSPTYAREIQTYEQGCGMDGLLRARAGVLSGILNGIDTEVWDPGTDAAIAATYGSRSLKRRGTNKAALQRRFALEEADRLLFGVVSRLAWQKGLDLLADAVPVMLEAGAQLAVIGSGEPELERRFAALAAAHPGQVGCMIGYDERLAHLMQAGADALVVPSRFEPCGLTQMCALRYGAVPVVAKVGGLADTVVDAEAGDGATGIQFSPVMRDALEGAIGRAVRLWSARPEWRRLQANGMATDVSWARSAKTYAALYANLLAGPS